MVNEPNLEGPLGWTWTVTVITESGEKITLNEYQNRILNGVLRFCNIAERKPVSKNDKYHVEIKRGRYVNTIIGRVEEPIGEPSPDYMNLMKYLKGSTELIFEGIAEPAYIIMH